MANELDIPQTLDEKNPFVLVEQDGEVVYAKWKIHELENLEALQTLQNETSKKVFFITPFGLVQKEGQGEAHGNESILALEVEEEVQIKKEEFMSLLPEMDIETWEINPSISDKNFWEKVKEVLERIEWWDISQCIISREFQTVLKDFSPAMLLTLYKRLLGIGGSYMTFMFHTWKQLFTAASPEMHLKVTEDTVEKRPIAGTMAKKNFEEQEGEKSFFDRLVEFLQNPKEDNELAMVIDEELKMLMKISNGWKIEWPKIREIGAVIHTENHFVWKRKKDMSFIEILRKTLYSPTLVWSPLKSAFSRIKEMEEASRWYYGWSFWYLDWKVLDTCISIRMAVINNLDGEDSKVSVRAWAWIVNDSTPEWETQETTNKANWFLWILKDQKLFESYLSRLTSEQKDVIDDLLQKRREKLSDFYTRSQDENLEVEKIKWKKFVLINNGDDFVYMLSYMITRMGWIVDIIENEDFNEDTLNNDAIVLLWPWPWDINDENDPKMQKLLEVAKSLQEKWQKMIWICLGHQALCHLNGMKIPRQEKITQWVQKEIKLFGEKKTVGYYNSYSPVAQRERHENDVVEGERLMYRQTENQVSMQFHPESIMSKDGFDILEQSILSIL